MVALSAARSASATVPTRGHATPGTAPGTAITSASVGTAVRASGSGAGVGSAVGSGVAVGATVAAGSAKFSGLMAKANPVGASTRIDARIIGSIARITPAPSTASS